MNFDMSNENKQSWNKQSWFRKIYWCCLLSSLCTIYVWILRYYPVYWYAQDTNQNNGIKLIVGALPSIVSYSQGLFAVWQLTQLLADDLINKDSGVKFENIDVQGDLIKQIKLHHYFRTFIMLVISALSLILVSAVSQTGAIAVFNKGEQYITSTTDPTSVYNDLNSKLTLLSQFNNGVEVIIFLFAIPDQIPLSSYGEEKAEIFLIGNYSSYTITNKVTKSLPSSNTTRIFTGKSDDGIVSILLYEECKLVSVSNSVCNNNSINPTYIRRWNTNSFVLQQFGIIKPNNSGCSAITIACTYTSEIRNGSIHIYGNNQPTFRGDTVPIVNIPDVIYAIDNVVKTVMFALTNATLNINTEVAQMATLKLQLISYNSDMTINVQDTALLSIIISSLIVAAAVIPSHPTLNIKLTSQASYSDYFGGLVVPDWQVYTILIYPIFVITTGIYLSINIYKSRGTAIIGGWISSHISFLHNLHNLRGIIYKQNANNIIDNQLIKEYKNIYIKVYYNTRNGLVMMENPVV